MKSLPILVGSSFLANGLILTIAVLRPAATQAFFHDVIYGDSAPCLPNAPGTSVQFARRRDEMPGTWRTADFSDFHALRTRLQNEGFPPFIARAVITAAVNEHFVAKERRLIPRRRLPQEYWRNPPVTRPASLEVREAMRELDRERSRALQELLGDEFQTTYENDETAALRIRRYGGLPLATIAQVERIMSDYADLTVRVRDNSLGITLPEDYEKLAMLEREKRVDLERLLTPAGLVEYELRNSPSASAVRNRLGQFAATEDEFRALYVARKAFDDIYSPPSGNVAPEVASKRLEAERKLEDQFRTILGEDRYVEYQRSNHPALLAELSEFGASATAISRIAARLNLPATTTPTVLALQEDFYRRANAIVENRQLSSQTRQTQLMQLGIVAMGKFTDALSGVGYQAYRANGGRWIDELMRPSI